MFQTYEQHNGEHYILNAGGLRTWRDIATAMLEGGPQAVEDLLGPAGVATLDALELNTWIPNFYTWGSLILAMSPVQQWMAWTHMGALMGHITPRDRSNLDRVLNLNGRSP